MKIKLLYLIFFFFIIGVSQLLALNKLELAMVDDFIKADLIMEVEIDSIIPHPKIGYYRKQVTYYPFTVRNKHIFKGKKNIPDEKLICRIYTAPAKKEKIDKDPEQGEKYFFWFKKRKKSDIYDIIKRCRVIDDMVYLFNNRDWYSYNQFSDYRDLFLENLGVQCLGKNSCDDKKDMFSISLRGSGRTYGSGKNTDKKLSIKGFFETDNLTDVESYLDINLFRNLPYKKITHWNPVSKSLFDESMYHKLKEGIIAGESRNLMVNMFGQQIVNKEDLYYYLSIDYREFYSALLSLEQKKTKTMKGFLYSEISPEHGQKLTILDYKGRAEFYNFQDHPHYYKKSSYQEYKEIAHNVFSFIPYLGPVQCAVGDFYDTGYYLKEDSKAIAFVKFLSFSTMSYFSYKAFSEDFNSREFNLNSYVFLPLSYYATSKLCQVLRNVRINSIDENRIEHYLKKINRRRKLIGVEPFEFE